MTTPHEAMSDPATRPTPQPDPHRQRLYGGLGKPKRRHEPPQTEAAHWLRFRGTQEIRITSPGAYGKEAEMTIQFGNTIIVLSGEEALRSFREASELAEPMLEKLIPPDLDAELRRQHREVLQRELAEQASRARVNGTEPVSSILERRMEAGMEGGGL